MAKKKARRLAGHEQPKRRWRWIDRLSDKEVKIIKEETLLWINDEYPGIASIDHLVMAMKSAKILPEKVTVASFYKWVQEFRRGEIDK